MASKQRLEQQQQLLAGPGGFPLSSNSNSESSKWQPKKSTKKSNNHHHPSSSLFGDELYRIGASLLPPLFPAVTKTRIRFHSPHFILFLTLLYVLQGLAILSTPTHLHSRLIWFGDISVIIGAHVPFTGLQFTYDYITASILFLSWRQNVKFRQFGALPPREHFYLANGLYPPEHFGLINSPQLEAFTTFVRQSFPLCALNTNVVLPAEVFAAFYAIFALKMLTMDPETEAPLSLWLITGAFSAFYALKTHLAFAFLLFHILHFYVICGYLSLKFDRLLSCISSHNSSLNQSSKTPNFEDPKHLISRLSELLILIRTYNSSFWSAFIFLLWSSLTINVAIFLYIVFYIEAINRFNRVVSALVGGLEFIALSAFFMKAGEVNQRAVKVYKKLNGVVSGNGLVAGVRMRIKFAHSMENWSSTKIGFTCGRLFSVNYFTYYEICIIIATFFLKLTQFQLLQS